MVGAGISDRLGALGADPTLPALTSKTAAAAWLGEKYQSVIDDFDRDWHKQNGPKWRERYDYVMQSKKTLSELAEKPTATLTDEELWEKACLTEEFVDAPDARALFGELQGRQPEHPATAFALGRLSFNVDDEDVLRQMKIALRRSDLTIDACQYAYSFLERHDRLDEAQWWIDRADEQTEVDRAAAAERQELTNSDEVVSIELSEEQIAYIVEKLKLSGKVKQAWLAQKKLQHYPDSPALAIAVKLKGMSFSEDSGVKAIQEHLDLNCDYFILPKSGQHKKLAKKVMRAGQQII